MTVVVGGITFPEPDTWIVHPGRLNDVALGLRDVALGALSLYRDREDRPRDQRYERVYVGHGTADVVEQSTAKQLSLLLPRVYVGRPSEDQATAYKGEPGKLAQQTADVRLIATSPWPKRQSTSSLRTTEIDAVRSELWTDGIIIWNAMLALALGGIVYAPDPTLFTPRDIAVGPLQARNPMGGQASWVIQMQVQL